jgi:hypothetical protein
MKRKFVFNKGNILLLLLFLLCFTLTGQRRQDRTWFDISVKGGYGSSFLLNKNIHNDKNVRMGPFSPCFSYGARLGFFINEYTGISLEAQNFLFSPSYAIDNAGVSQNINYKKTIKFSSFAYSLLFRIVAFKSIYAEAGPKITKLNSVNVINSIEESFNDSKMEGYTNRFTSVLLGAGIAVVRSRDDRFRLNVGVRLDYCLDDIVMDLSKPPVKDGVYEWNYQYRIKYNTFHKTSPLNLQVVVELNYFFAYYGRGKKGKYKLEFFKKT